MHFARMIKLFGPVYAWWLFAFERFNGMLEKVKLHGHDGGRVELTMMRYWVQAHQLYELLLSLPDNASDKERNLIDRIIRTGATRIRGGTLTDLAILQAETSADRVSLPKRTGKVDLYNLRLRRPGAADLSDVYTLLLEHCQRTWPAANLRRELSAYENGPPLPRKGAVFTLTYVRKDSIRYGATTNVRTQADTFAFIQHRGKRTPVEIEALYLVRLSDLNLPDHVCALVRRLATDEDIPRMPWSTQ